MFFVLVFMFPILVFKPLSLFLFVIPNHAGSLSFLLPRLRFGCAQIERGVPLRLPLPADYRPFRTPCSDRKVHKLTIATSSMEAHVSGIGTHIERASSSTTEPSIVMSAPAKRYVAFANGVIDFLLLLLSSRHPPRTHRSPSSLAYNPLL